MPPIREEDTPEAKQQIEDSGQQAEKLLANSTPALKEVAQGMHVCKRLLAHPVN